MHLIRAAEPEDAEGMVRCAAPLAELSPATPFDSAYTVQWLRDALSRPDAGFVAFVAAAPSGQILGAITAVIGASWTSPEIVCSEMAWWAATEHRGSVGLDLLRALEHEARNRGATRLYVSTQLATREGAVAGRILEARTYHPHETLYVMTLS